MEVYTNIRVSSDNTITVNYLSIAALDPGMAHPPPMPLSYNTPVMSISNPANGLATHDIRAKILEYNGGDHVSSQRRLLSDLR